MGDGPFAILELDEATATPAGVKAAYARLVKLHRPDRDPAGFRRIRDAYELCLLVVEETTDAARAPSSPADFAADIAPGNIPVPPADEPEVDRPLPRVPPVAQADPPAPATPGNTSPLHPEHPREMDDVPGIIAAWRAGDDILPQISAARWEEHRDWARLADLGRAWRELLDQQPHPGCGEIALILAHRLALVDGTLATELADGGFRHASGTRQHLVAPDLDLRLHIGRHLNGLDEGLRWELLSALKDGDLATSAVDLPRRLRAGLAGLPRDPHTTRMLRDQLPTLWGTDPPPTEGTTTRPTRVDRQQPPEPAQVPWGILIFLSGLLMSALVRFCHQQSPSNAADTRQLQIEHPRPMVPPPHPGSAHPTSSGPR